MRDIDFSKLSGSGNDFACIDNRDGRFDGLLDEPEAIALFAQSICHRGIGVGADGVIFACHHEVEEFADIAARFFEADGSEAELCGNGIGCFVHWAVRLGMVPADRDVKILTPAGVVRGQNDTDDYVRACIPDPQDIQQDMEIEAAGVNFECDFAVTGVPHLITYVEDIEKVDVAKDGYALRHHEKFNPRGVNANFVEIIEEGEIAIRTFEFGVESETLACGTGSAAAAILAAKRFGWDEGLCCHKKPVLVRARSGDVLRIYFEMAEDGTVTDICLETIVRFVYSGKLHPDLIKRAMGKSDNQ